MNQSAVAVNQARRRRSNEDVQSASRRRGAGGLGGGGERPALPEKHHLGLRGCERQAGGQGMQGGGQPPGAQRDHLPLRAGRARRGFGLSGGVGRRPIARRSPTTGGSTCATAAPWSARCTEGQPLCILPREPFN